jgi:hypothetical protein
MRKRSFAPLAIATLFAILADAAPASAQLWVASYGSNNSSCNRASPCRYFSQALAVSIVDAAIGCIDSGDFIDDLTITKAVTFDCSETHATLKEFSPSRIAISGTGSSDVVILKGLDLNYQKAGLNNVNQVGIISFTGAGFLTIDNVKIANFLGNAPNGILFAPTGGARLNVSNVSIANLGSSGIVAGIYIKPVSSGIDVHIENSRISHNQFGIVADGSLGQIHGTLVNSTITDNVNNGVTVAGGSSVFFLVKDTTVAHNNFGLVADNRSGMLVSRSAIIANANGLVITGGGVVYSYGNNELNGNTVTDGAFSGTIALK